MRISITGANGFLGKKIIDEFRRHGHHVIAWIRNPSIPGYQIDCRDFDLLQSQNINLKDSDVVIHCAAYLPSNYEDISESEKCLSLNGISTLKMLQAANRDGVKKFIYISSGQIYDWEVNEATENDKLNQLERATPYLISKYVGDTFVRAYRGKMDTTILRPSYIYGPGMRNSGLLPRLVKIVQDKTDLNTINNYMVDLVYVEDVARIVFFMSTTGYTGVYNVGGYSISVHDLIYKLADIMDVNVLPIDEIKLDRGHPTLDISKLKNLEYKPMDIMDGLRLYWKSIND